VNFKERLTSTENLLRSIRSGEAPAPPTADAAGEPVPNNQGSMWTKRISLGDVFSGRSRRARSGPAATAQAAPPTASASPSPLEIPPAASAAASPKSAPPFWTRPISFRRGGKPLSVGVSVSGTSLCVAAVRGATNSVAGVRAFPISPGQFPGEKDFPKLLRASLDAMGITEAKADIWAVLRSPDLDLNVLAVPRLTGSKLDAAVYWTLQKEKKFADAEYVLDYLVLGHTDGGKTPKLDVLTCLARKADVEALAASFREAGRPLAGITAIPNAFLALYRQRGAPTGFALAANIHVEPDFSAIGLYTKDRLLFSRFIRSGGGSMRDALADYYQELAKPRPAALDDLELPLPGAEPEGQDARPAAATPLTGDEPQDILRHALLGGPRPACADRIPLVTPDQAIDIIAPAIERLARQVERTLDYYASTQQARCDALHLSGEIFGSTAIAQALAGQLGFAPTAFDATAILPGGNAVAKPEDRMLMAPALAAALSLPERGINLLKTYKTRTAEEAKRTVTRRLLLGLAGVMVLLGGLGFVAERANTAKRQELAQLNERLAALGPTLDDGAIQADVNLYRARQDALREASARLLAPAALAEIGACAPENVRILSFTAEYPLPDAAKPTAPAAPGQPAAQPPQPTAGPKAAPKTSGIVTIEGVVSGDRAEFDASLARFILSLQASPMFSMPVVNESSLKDLSDGGQVLSFTMHLGIK